MIYLVAGRDSVAFCFILSVILLINCDPSLQLSKGPEAFAFISGVSVDNTAHAMLHAFFPLTLVLTSIRISVSSFTVLLIESVIPFVFATVLPHVVSIAVHHTALEHSFEVAAV